MYRLNLTTIVFGLLTLAACSKKNVTADKTSPALTAGKTANAVEECQPIMYSLTVDSATGASYIFKVTGSPGAGPVLVEPYVVSGTNQLKDCKGNPILRASGLAYDPTGGIFWGTTGASGSLPNVLLKFIDPNCVSIVTVPNLCDIELDLSDVEMDPSNGMLYAINRNMTYPNNRIVQLGFPGSPGVTCLPNPFPGAGLTAQGLTFDCKDQLYVISTSGTAGKIVYVDKKTGIANPAYMYPGPIALPGFAGAPEVGLHFDCDCIGRFITGSFNPVSATLMTDGLPSDWGGKPIYNALAGALQPTVDFARIK